MPLVQKLQEDLKGRSDVLIVAHNSGADSPETIAQYFKDSGFAFQPLVDAGDRGADGRSLAVKYYPTNFVLGPDGRILHASVGFNEPRIRELLGAPPKG